MKVLWLGPANAAMHAALCAAGDTYALCEAPLSPASPELGGVEFLVSYGYRHILRPEVLALFDERAINIHISLLPWNRGADPNLWSFLEDTPKGVSIHRLDAGLDTGPLLAQTALSLSPSLTLRQSYNELANAAATLFCQSWPAIRRGDLAATPQAPGGSLHRLRDRAQYQHLLAQGWDTPVAGLIGQALRR